MLICTDCGGTFETADIVQEHHPYGMGYAVEEIGVCPCCGSTEICQAVKCMFCGEWVEETDSEGLCKFCHDDIYG